MSEETGQEPTSTAQRVANQVFPEGASTGAQPPARSTTNNEGASDDSQLTREQALAELQRVRREAAGRRVTTREQEDELKKFREWQDAQKTEQQKLAEQNASLLSQVEQFQVQQRQSAAARAAGLPLEWADRVRGASDEEMVADAKKLAESLKGGAGAPGGNLFGGARGADLGANRPTNPNDWVNNMIRTGGAGR